MTAHSDLTLRILVVDDHQVVRQGLRGFTNLDRYQFIPEDQEPDQPALIEAVGSAARAAAWAAARKGLECAVRPLPPRGPLAFVCAWPGRGLPASRERLTPEQSWKRPTPP